MQNLLVLGFLLFTQDVGIRHISKDKNCPGIAFSANSGAVAWIPNNGIGGVRIWDLKANKELPQLKAKVAVGSLRSIAWSPDSKVVATIDGSGTVVGDRIPDCFVRIWEFPSGKLRKELQVPGMLFGHALKFSQDGKLLAAGGDQAVIPVIDVQEGKLLKLLQTEGTTEDLAFTNDGKSVASSSGEIVKVWSIDNGEKVARFEPSFSKDDHCQSGVEPCLQSDSILACRQQVHPGGRWDGR